MLAFKAVYDLSDDEQIKEITIKETNIQNASSITVIPVNAVNFTPIADPIIIYTEE